MKEKDISKMMDMAKNINIDSEKLSKLKTEADKRGVMDKAKDLEEEYAPKFKEFLRKNPGLSNLSNEEKARVILEYKAKLPKREQEQFEKVLKMLKMYVKKNKER